VEGDAVPDPEEAEEIVYGDSSGGFIDGRDNKWI